MKKIIMVMAGFAAIATSVTLPMSAAASVTISDVIVRQQWPWNGKVNIDYVLSDPDDGVHDIAVEMRNAGQVVTNEYGSLTGDLIGVKQGARRIVWDPFCNGATYSDKVMASFSVTLSTSDDDNTYMIVDLSGGASAASYPVTFTNKPPAGGWTDEYKTNKLVLRRIPAGSAVLGSPTDEIGHDDYWETQRRTTFTNSFYMAVFETTQKQFENVMGYNPVTTESAMANTKPVSSVVYQLLRGTNVNAQASAASTSFFGVLASKLSAELSAAGFGDYEMELPTISQWEYACRAGTTGSYNNGTSIDEDTATDPNADLLAWYGGNLYAYAEGVGKKLPNAFGLYDMHGNVGELTRDKVNSTTTIWDGTAQVEPLLTGGQACLCFGGFRNQSTLGAGLGAKGVRSSSAKTEGTMNPAQRGFRIALTRKR
jgi:formylglycine-generating enzyme required for sulfatase activity